MSAPLSISAILPAFDREETTRATVARIAACDPPPTEIIVHIDAGRNFKIPGATKILHSDKAIGPGGARNRLLAESTAPYVVSFDDDSFPESSDFFARAAEKLAAFPGYAIYALDVRHPNSAHNSPLPGGNTSHETTLFQGCGCIYDRTRFLATEGYIPLARAYGMEEIDLALRLHAAGERTLTLPDLAVIHDADLSHHSTPEITAAALANQALFALLRYPKRALPLALAQYLHKALDQLLRGRIMGTITGILKTPKHLAHSAKLRDPVPPSALRSFRFLTRHPKIITTHG